MAAEATIFLVRHGRTPLNAAGVLRGRIDTPLDDVGQAEARALGDTFRGVGLGGVVSSPLVRAYDTAAAIARTSGDARHAPIVDAVPHDGRRP
jgi:broad specificity phosphatase PhoE